MPCSRIRPRLRDERSEPSVARSSRAQSPCSPAAHHRLNRVGLDPALALVSRDAWTAIPCTTPACRTPPRAHRSHDRPTLTIAIRGYLARHGHNRTTVRRERCRRVRPGSHRPAPSALRSSSEGGAHVDQIESVEGLSGPSLWPLAPRRDPFILSFAKTPRQALRFARPCGIRRPASLERRSSLADGRLMTFARGSRPILP